MSAITADHTDPKLEDLKKAVCRKSDKVPFLLLPVRMETRFMKVEKARDQPTHESNDIQELWLLLAEVKVLLGQELDQVSQADIKAMLAEVMEKLESGLNLLDKNLSTITVTQRKLSLESLNAIRPLLEAKALGPFSSLTKQITRLLQKMMALLQAEPGVRETVYQAGSDYLLEMKNLELRLLHIGEGKIPFTRIVHKKQLYIFVERLIRDHEQWYQNAANKAEQIQLLEPSQYSSIQRVHASLQNLLPQAGKVLSAIHSDKNWRQFFKQINGAIQDIGGLQKKFDQQVLPKLQFLSEVETVSADALFHQHVKLLEQVENLYLHPDDAVVKKAEPKLRKAIKKLGRNNQKLINSNAEQYAYLKAAWSRLDKRIPALDPRIKGEAKGKSKARKKSQNPNFRKGLNLLVKPTVPTFTPELSPSDNHKLADLQKLYEYLKSAFVSLLKFTQSRNFNVQQAEKALTGIKKHLQKALASSLSITATQQRQFDQAVQQLSKQIQAAKLSAKEQNSLLELLKSVYADLHSLSTATLNTKAGEYKFEAAATTSKLLPAYEIVDELWVRIFPDDIFVHTHETPLTEEEEKAAHDYWKTTWAVNEDQETVLSVWRMACSRFGKNRAAYIVKATDPADLGRENQKIFQKKPKNFLHAAIPQLEWLQENLLPPEKESEETPHPFDNEEVLKQFQLANKNLGQALKKLQYVRLAESCKVLSRNIYSKLYELDNDLSGLSQNLKETTSRMYEANIVSAFNQQQKLLSQLKVVTFTQYLRQVEIPFAFPETKRRSSAWSEVPHTKVLPEAFAVITMQGDQFEHIVIGKDIPEELPLGMDPNLDEEAGDEAYQLDEHGNLIVEEGIRWMTDFEEAVKVGMAVKLPLSAEQAERGFDRVLVLGIKESGTQKSQQLLEELLENHQYAADGLSFVTVGTPTNNTEGESSGYGSIEEELDAAHDLALGAPLFDPNESDPLNFADGKRVADAFGIHAATVQHLANADGREISNAQIFNRCLSYATLRDYMEEMMDSLFTQDNIERTQTFFNDSVIARGALPSFRIGHQPYGILPVSAFSRYTISPAYDVDHLPPPSNETNLQLRFEIRLQEVLSLMHTQWTAMRKERVNHAEKMSGSTDPQPEFMDMLGLNANTAESYFRYGVNIAYRGSSAVNSEFIGDYQEEDAFAPLQLYYLFQKLIDNGEFAGEISTDNVSHFEKSRLFRCRFLEETASILGGYVQDDHPETADTPLPDDAGPDYINWLLEQTNLYEILNDNDAASFPSRSLLFLLLRQAFLIAYREVAMDIVQEEDLIDSAFRRIIGSSEHYISPKQKFRTKWSYLMLDFTIDQSGNPGNFDPYFDFSRIDNDDNFGLTDLLNHPFVDYLSDRDFSIAQYLFFGYLPSRFPNHEIFFDKISQIRNDFSRLTDLSSKALDQLLREHLDLCYYRLDAWILGLYYQRLRELREERPEGILLGAYAWVEDLRPGGARTEAKTVPDQLLQDGDTVYTDADNQGFMHAPSLNQAIAAAVLRSGYHANSFEEDINNKFAVNLSSFRVRKAMTVLSGIANGQELSAILGYQFEKGLHERFLEVELDRFIPVFRKEFPLTVPVADELTANDIQDSLTTNVINALDLLNRLEEEVAELDFAQQSSLYEVLTLDNFKHCPAWLKEDLIEANGGGEAEINAILSEIDQIADTFDAIGDLVTSESVYQIVQGNHVRAAAIIQALADGKSVPEPQIIYTPRTGTLVNHRLVLCLDPTATAGSEGWTATTVRASTEPAVNGYLGQVLGSAEDIQVMVHIGETVADYNLNVFSLQPIDLLYLVHPDPTNPNSALQDLIKFHLRTTDQIPAETSITIDFAERDNTWPANIKTIYELQPIITQLKELILDAKPLSAEDLILPAEGSEEEEDTKKQDLAELTARVEPVKESVLQLEATIGTFLENHPEELLIASDFTAARDYLIDAFYFGIPNTITGLGIEDSPEAGEQLLQRLRVVHGALIKKKSILDNFSTRLEEEEDPIKKVRIWIETAKTIFGPSFPITPQFNFTDQNDLADQLSEDPAKQLQFNSEENLAMDTWLQGMGRVRKKMAALEMQRILLEIDGQHPPIPKPVQLPFTSGDYWLGIDYPDHHQPNGDKLSLVSLDAHLLVEGASNSVGLILDEWTEMIPNKEEVSGISFNYDAPDATPPQTLLLAVSPQQKGKWEWDDLVYTLIDTLELAKNRAVEPDHLEQSVFGQILPAVVAEVVPPQVAEDGYANPLGTQVVMDFMDNLPPVEED